MSLSKAQIEIWKQILSAVETEPNRQIVYCSEWLGYLPFGAYHWVEVNGLDISQAFPSGWQRSDLRALEQAGVLRLVESWQNPEDEYHQKITYDLPSSVDLAVQTDDLED